MIKNLVVGSGFSAAITKIFLGKNSRVIGFKKKIYLEIKIILEESHLI